MRGTRSAPPGIARLLTLCAVLVGVFLMHGLPAQSCAGGSMPVTMTVMAPVHVAPLTEMGPGHDDLCVFTMPSHGSDGLLALLLIAVVAWFAPLWPSSRVFRHRRRGPPLAGVRLLSQVCVSRT